MLLRHLLENNWVILYNAYKTIYNFTYTKVRLEFLKFLFKYKLKRLG